MSKTHTPKKSKSMSILRTPGICDTNWPGNYNDTVQWQNVPAACTISQDGTNTFPFSPNPVNPATQIATIIVKPPTTQPYSYAVSCCANEATKKVIVTG